MFIKQLEIFGFKSFKERTVFRFENQEITGIVGPNGCGKSNIVDALLWVMGENSPKHLRGESLSDIIFGGTSKEPSSHLAEVQLILNPGNRGFPLGYEKFSEVMISRRSYREGKNECFINDKECLLRDIREFFMNTGAGCRGFSIIEQESIERLITAKPLQRRYIIEEAAGITKFKNQKTDSLRKLQLVDQNLKRLDDVLKLQSNQLSHLSSQAKKAEKYKKLKKEIEFRDKQITRFHYQNLVENQKTFQLEISGKEKQKNLEKTALFHKKTAFPKLIKQIQDNQKQIEEFRQKLTEKKMEEARLKDKAKTFEIIESVKQKMDQAEKEQEEIQSRLIEFKESFKENYKSGYIQTEILKVKNKLDEIKQNKNSLQVHIDLLTKQIEFVKKEKNSLSLEEESLSESIKQNINKKNQTRALITKEKNNQIITEKNLIELNNREKELTLKKEDLEKELNQLKPRVAALLHKIEELDKLLSQLSNLNKGAEHLIKWKPEQFHSLFEKLEVEPKYIKALSVVLGPLAHAIVPEELLDLEQGIEELKSLKKGKSWFLTRLPQATASLSLREKLKSYPAVMGFLDEKVSWNIFNSALKPLLEKTALVSDLKSALELKKNFPLFQFVTLEADLITENSVVYAGSQDQENGLLEIRNQVKDSGARLILEKTKLKAKELEWENCLKQIKELKDKQQSQEKKLSSFSDYFKSSERDIEFLEKDLMRLSEIRGKKREKIRDFQEKQEGLSEHTLVFNADIKKQEKLVSFKQSYLNLLNLAFENIKSQEALEKEEKLLLNVINTSDSSVQTSSISELKNELERNQTEKKDLGVQLSVLQEEWDFNHDTKNQTEKDIKALEQSLFQIQLDAKSLLSEKDKKEIEKTHLKEKFKDSYQMNIEDFDLDANLSLDKLKEEMSDFQAQLDRIKEVNFLALGEYEKLSQEHEFLTRQKEDLLSSQKGILKVISHIDKTCKTRFNDMLEETNKRFSKVFPIVFEGDNAKAELVLHEEDGEQGVDIKVHPPGKKPQSISLLSRGEKALTSICLIYSLFLVKPSPFCIIDEADAPLDDANIFRFLSVLKEMSRNSQIIVITHNKYTMRHCNKLYGVTQKQPGVSQTVSVDMNNSSLTSR